MRGAKQTLDETFLEIRWRCLSLAADLDRVEKNAGGADVLNADPRIQKLRQAIHILLDAHLDRAERVQMLFSDTTEH
ncbi:MAG TPA: hypothetical protein VLI90_18710 [Tepidisphaeraceae bacterium]|nr:hypothetical protein [Tepidisphaeraceae bacterium]